MAAIAKLSKRPSNIGFFDVDTQYELMKPSGTVYIEGAEKIIPNLKKLYNYAKRKKLRIIAPVDTHIRVDDPEFRIFPAHCMKGTFGQKKIKWTLLKRHFVIELGVAPKSLREILKRYQQILIEKSTINVFNNPITNKLLKVIGIKNWVVFGVATDYCIRATVLGLLERCYKVIVISDAIRGDTETGSKKAIKEMRKAGATFKTTNEVLKSVLE